MGRAGGEWGSPVRGDEGCAPGPGAWGSAGGGSPFASPSHSLSHSGVRRGSGAGGGERTPLRDPVLTAKKREHDRVSAVLFKPHSLSVLVAVVGLLALRADVFWTRRGGGERDPLDGARDGVLGCVTVLLGYFCSQAPDGMLVRPHPAVWRGVLGLSVAYLCVLSFLLVQDAAQARDYLRVFDANLGAPLEERSYGEACAVWDPSAGAAALGLPPWHNVQAAVLDRFLLAHFFGWFAKALIVRERGILWVLSVGFELVERAMTHVLPNFAECWWDSVILDVLVCNLAGMELGLAVCRWADVKLFDWYNWRTVSSYPTLRGKARRTLSQFAPFSWDTYAWEPLSSPGRFLQVLFFVLVVLTVEVNAFLLKTVLWVPPESHLNIVRLALWALISVPATQEYYVFIAEPSADGLNKLGAQAWISCAIVLTEVCMHVKFAAGMFPDFWSPPPHVTYAGALLFLALVLWFLALFIVRPAPKRLSPRDHEALRGDGRPAHDADGSPVRPKRL